MKYLLLVISLVCYSVFISFAQSRTFTIARAASVNVSESNEDWNPVLQENDDGEVADEYQKNDQLNLLKQQLLMQMHPSGNKSSGVRDVIDTPYVWQDLQGNIPNGSVPNDNDIAVSTTGFLISVMNTTIFKYDLNKDSSLGSISLTTFGLPLGNMQSKYDPKVIYDPNQNKFIIAYLSGFASEATNITIGFSQTDDPNGIWNLYELPGNPLNDSLWSDFPALGLTNHELLITVNHLVDDESWQTGWRRTVIWQMNKFDGFNGDSLHTQLHYDIGFNGSKVRNLCPVKGGSRLYGADIYFLSERNLDVENDTIFLVHLTDTMNAPSQMLTVQALVSDVPYFVPVNAKQPFIRDLVTNDSRVLGAFYENDRIQFVGNTTDTVTGTASIYHGVITNVAYGPKVTLHLVSDDAVCYAYPNIAYVGNSSADNTAVIGVLRSAVNLFPGYSALMADGQGNYSAVKNIKNGLGYHYLIPGLQRWGDYSGIQRDYSSAGKVWMNGSFSQANHKMYTWISELSLSPPSSFVPPVTIEQEHLKLYPNPSRENITIQFEQPNYTSLNFEVYDLNGRLLKLLMNERVRPGNNLFSFSTVPLSAGVYELRISSAEKIIAREKFVRE